MQQYREGQRLRGSDGNIYVVRNGAPVSEAPAIGQAIGNDPRIPGTIRAQDLQAERTQQEIAKNPLDVANIQTGMINTNDQIRSRQIGNVQELRKEFNTLPEVKNYAEYLNQMSKALRAPDSPQGDLSVIYAFAKAMDPGSVVREGEMDMANSTSSLVQDMYRRFGRITEGNRLPANVRNGLVESIRSSGHGFKDAYDQQYVRYRDQAIAIGADPKQVVDDHKGDAFRVLEEKYIKEHGGTPRHPDGAIVVPDYATMVGDTTADTPVEPGAATRREPYPEASAVLDSLARGNLGYDEANRQFKARFPDQGDIPKDQFNAARAFLVAHPGYEGSLGAAQRDVPLESPLGAFDPANTAGSALNSFSQTGPGAFAANLTNATAAGIPGALAGERGEAALDIMRQQHPYASAGGEITGLVAGNYLGNRALGSAARALSDIPYLRAPASFLANRPAANMLAGDIGFGGAYGATQSPDRPLAGAALGGAAGLGGNVVGRYVAAPAFRAGAARLGFNPAPAISAGEGYLAGETMRAGPGAVLGKLEQASDLNLPYTLADADPRLRALGGVAVRKSPDAYASASSNLGDRTLGQVDRLTDIVESDLGPRLNLPTFKEGVKKTAQSKSRGLYESAKSQGPVDDAQINEMLRTPAGQRAARSGYDEAINNNEPVGDLVEEVDSITGQIRLTGRPSWHVLQRMKFALDEMPEQSSLARRFNSRLGTINPDFRKANQVYSKEMSLGDVAQSGYDAANPGIRSPELSAAVAAPKNTQNLPLFKQGYGSNLVDRARGMRDTANPYGTAAMASPDQLAKMDIVSPQLASRFKLARGLEDEMALTNRELFGGSQTQPRAAADKLFDEGGLVGDAVELGLSVASGTPPINAFRSKLFAGRGMFSAARDAYRFGLGRTARQSADQMAPVLFNPNPQETSAQLAALIRQQALRDAYVQRTGMFGAGAGAPLAVGYYNSQ